MRNLGGVMNDANARFADDPKGLCRRYSELSAWLDALHEGSWFGKLRKLV